MGTRGFRFDLIREAMTDDVNIGKRGVLCPGSFDDFLRRHNLRIRFISGCDGARRCLYFLLQRHKLFQLFPSEILPLHFPPTET